jgi:hypothetical protein
MTGDSTARQPRRVTRGAAAALLTLLLGIFYYAGATEHARRMNTSRVRADQSGYLWDAVAVYKNRHGDNLLIGERNRMPVYPGFLSLFYHPSLAPDEFFEVGKRWNIRLSLVLLAALGLVFHRHLPRLAAANLLLVTAFGYFIFKAGYAQSELLFYSFLFAAFLCFCYLLRGLPRRRGIAVAALAGILAALAHLTKAAALPLVGIFSAVYFIALVLDLVRSRRLADSGARGSAVSDVAWRGAALAVFAACFLATLYPYISNSKRVFGHYFYNVNTTFYIWYDDWPAASLGTYKHGDGVGWPDMPARDLPSMRKYLREHTARQIVERFRGGFADMIVVTYQRFWIMKFLVLYTAAAVLLAAANGSAFRRMLEEYRAPAIFMLLYAGVYLPAIAFYDPISGTTTRMLLAHVAPYLFTLSCFITRPPFRDTRVTAAGTILTTDHFHWFVFAVMLSDVAFFLWPRLMADFTGY